MIRYSLVFFLAILSSDVFADPLDNACPVRRGERLACSVLLCNPIGLAIAESRSECLQVNIDFAVYMATAGFLRSRPRCYSRDQNCNRTGRASTAEMGPEYCVGAGSTDKQQACMAALGAAPEGYCNNFTGYEREACISVQTTGRFSENYCIHLATERRSGAWALLNNIDRELNEERYEDCMELYDLTENELARF